MRFTENLHEPNEKNRKIIDLSYTLSTASPVWPGEEEPELQRTSTLDRDGANVSQICLNVHTETHVDAPKHFYGKGATIDDIPLDSFAGRAAVYRCPEKPEGGEVSLEQVKGSGIELEEKDVFILVSGLEELRGDSSYFREFPVPSTELLNWLLEKGIKCYGTDCPSVDPLGSESHEKHKLLLAENIPIVENLANMDQISEKKDIFFLAFPLKLKGLEASPCRALAMIGPDCGPG